MLSPASTEVVRQMEANGTSYATREGEPGDAPRRRGRAACSPTPSGIVGADKAALLREEVVLTGRFSYAITKLDRGDLYPDALAVPGGDPELTGLAGVTPATATTPDTRTPITFQQAEQAAFNVEGIPRYDHIFIVMLENKSTQAILGSAFAPKINALPARGQLGRQLLRDRQPERAELHRARRRRRLRHHRRPPVELRRDGRERAAGSAAARQRPSPASASSPFAATCTQIGRRNHNIVGKPNLFNALTAAGMTWRTYNESMNPGQDIRTDSVADAAVIAPDNVYAPGTLAATPRRSATPSLRPAAAGRPVQDQAPPGHGLPERAQRARVQVQQPHARRRPVGRACS